MQSGDVSYEPETCLFNRAANVANLSRRDLPSHVKRTRRPNAARSPRWKNIFGSGHQLGLLVQGENVLSRRGGVKSTERQPYETSTRLSVRAVSQQRLHSCGKN